MAHSNASSIVIFLLPEIHEVPENKTFQASGLTQLSIYPLDEQQDVEIYCKLQGKILLLKLSEFRMSSLHFNNILITVLSMALHFDHVIHWLD